MSRTKPIKNAVVEDAPDYLVLFPDGRVFRDVEVSVSKEEFLQMAEGYMCALCFEPQREAWPELCSLPGCNFPIKAEQRRYLDEHFQGERWLGPSKGTLAALDNELDRQLERRKNGSGSG